MPLLHVDPRPALDAWVRHHAERGRLPRVTDHLRGLVDAADVIPDAVAAATVNTAIADLNACYVEHGDLAPQTLRAMMRLATLLQQIGAYYTAGLYSRTVIRTLQFGAHAPSAHDPSAQWEAVELALLHHELGRCSRATTALDTLHRRLTRTYGPTHWLTVTAGIYRSYMRLRCGDVTAADRLMDLVEPYIPPEDADRLTKDAFVGAWSSAAGAGPHTCGLSSRLVLTRHS